LASFNVPFTLLSSPEASCIHFLLLSFPLFVNNLPISAGLILAPIPALMDLLP
jgi:hypothetical protein